MTGIVLLAGFAALAAVAARVPGCPPSPDAIAAALLELFDSRSARPA